MKKIAALLAVVGLAQAANAAAVGNIVFTSTVSDSIQYYNNGVVSTLFAYADPDVRLSDIQRGASGEFYVGSGPYPPNLTTNKSAIYRVDNLFGAATSSTLSSDFPLANPSGMVYNNATRRLLVVNNAQSEYNPVNPIRGVLAVNVDTAVVQTSYQQVAPGAASPEWYTANEIINNPYAGNNNYYVTCMNGGDAIGGPDGQSGVIWKFAVDPITQVGTKTLLLNYGDTGMTGLSSVVRDPRSLTLKESTGEMFIANADGGVYKILLDGAGNYISTSLLLATPGQKPDHIGYNPYTDKVVFSEELTQSIFQMNTDGTGLETVTTNAGARGFYFIPAPGVSALLGLAGLAAARRRRA